MSIASIGVDIGKLTFHLVALDAHGKVVVRKKFARKQLLTYTAKLKSVLTGIEACSGARCLGAGLRDQGHDVRLVPAQFVKPFLKSNKNDATVAPGLSLQRRFSPSRLAPCRLLKVADRFERVSFCLLFGM